MKETISYREALYRSMFSSLENSSNAIILGQGVTDPTRIFGTTKGLVEEFGSDRVIDMPIMEEGMTGIAIGAALNGLYPIQIHIRVDFLMLAMNQIINLAAKYRYMYGGFFEVPMLIRSIVGRSWGQGPQHSQSLQSLFAHIPGLTIIMPSSANDVLNAYHYAVTQYRSPLISIEHRFLYDTLFRVDDEVFPEHPLFSSRMIQRGRDVTIVATSYMVQEAQRATKWVKEHQGIDCEIIDLHIISHTNHHLILKSVEKTGRLIVADTGWLPFGVCAEICRVIIQNKTDILEHPVSQIGMQHTPCPTSHALERFFYPDMGTIVDAVYTQIFGTASHGMELPSEEYKRNQRIHFKGPF